MAGRPLIEAMEAAGAKSLTLVNQTKKPVQRFSHAGPVMLFFAFAAANAMSIYPQILAASITAENPIELRPYQRECVDAVVRDLATHRSVVAVQPTGSGKTIEALAIARQMPGPVLALAHRANCWNKPPTDAHHLDLFPNWKRPKPGRAWRLPLSWQASSLCKAID